MTSSPTAVMGKRQGDKDRQVLRLIVVASSDAEVQLLSAQVESIGFFPRAERVSSPDEVLRALHALSDDTAVLVALPIPQMSHAELLSALHEHTGATPLILVHDGWELKTAMACVRDGAYDVVLRGDLLQLGAALAGALRARHLHVQAQRYQQQLRKLTQHQEAVREAERVQLARTVHDEIGGLLTAIKMDVRWLQRKCAEQSNSCGSEEKFALLGEQLDSAINTVRRIITELRPSVLDDLGLGAAIEWQLREFERRHAIKCSIDNRTMGVERLGRDIEVAVFRIFQEALGYLIGHAGVSEVRVTLSSGDESLYLEVEDNGTAFSNDTNKNDNGGYGLLGMRERAHTIGGYLDAGQSPKGGNRISLALPLQQEGRERDEDTDR